MSRQRARRMRQDYVALHAKQQCQHCDIISSFWGMMIREIKGKPPELSEGCVAVPSGGLL